MFKTGDRVSWCGVEGKVVQEIKHKKNPVTAIIVEFDSFSADCTSQRRQAIQFCPDGRLYPWHKEPSLRKVE